MLTRNDLQAFIDANKIAATLIGDIGETPTVPHAARALGVSAEDIVKTLVFEVERTATSSSFSSSSIIEHVVVISFGERRVDKALLAAQLGVAKKRVSFAKGEDVLRLLGFPPGGVPPFGHASVLPLYVDEGLAQRDPACWVFPGGGDDSTMMKIQLGELLRVARPVVCKLG